MVIGNQALQSFGFDGFKVGGLPVSGLSFGKSKILARWREVYPGYDRYIVVDDSPAQYNEGWPGWEFFLPGQFLKDGIAQ